MRGHRHGEKIYRCAMLEPVVYLLRDMGCPWTAALQAAKIAEEELTSPSLRLSIDQLLDFYEEAMRIAADPVLPVAAGLRFHATTYGMYGFAILSSHDVRQALRFAIQYHRLASPVAEATFTEGPGLAAWRFRAIPHPRVVGPLYQFVVQLHAAIFLALLREVAGDEVAPQFVSLTFRPSAEAIRRLSIDVRVADENGLYFDAASLAHPTRMGSPAVNRMLAEICDAEVAQLKKREGLSGRVRELLIANAGRPIGIESIARELGLPERSLRRRLGDEGASLSELQDELRLQLAIELLRDTRLSVEDVADTLGFSEAASFRRAFRRWTRSTPSAYRLGAAT